jgi:hypothetical protein
VCQNTPKRFDHQMQFLGVFSARMVAELQSKKGRPEAAFSEVRSGQTE